MVQISLVRRDGTGVVLVRLLDSSHLCLAAVSHVPRENEQLTGVQDTIQRPVRSPPFQRYLSSAASRSKRSQTGLHLAGFDSEVRLFELLQSRSVTRVLEHHLITYLDVFWPPGGSIAFVFRTSSKNRDLGSKSLWGQD